MSSKDLLGLENTSKLFPLPGYWMCRPVIKGDNLYFAIINTYNWWNYDGMIAVLDKNNKVVSLPEEETIIQ